MSRRPDKCGPLLDLRDANPAAPWHWRQAPLPDAALVLIGPDGLHQPGHDRHWSASPALLAALAAHPGNSDALLVVDPSGTVWRLRHAGAAGGHKFWQMQALAESRDRLLAGLRRMLAPRLSGHVLHELRNPLGALSLHADLLGRLLPENGPPAPAERLRASAEVIRQRLRELGERQDAAVALWLEDEAEAAAPQQLDRLVEASLRLVRGYLSLHEVRLRVEALQALHEVNLRGHAAALQLALLAALLAACAGAKRTGADQVIVASSSIDGNLGLELRSALDGEALGRDLADCDGESLLAALALILQPSGITLQANPQQALLRFAFP